MNIPKRHITAWALLTLPALLFLSGCCHDDCCDFCRAYLDCSTPVHATVTQPAPAEKPAPVVIAAPPPPPAPAPVVERRAPRIEIAPSRSVVYASQNETNIRD